MVEPIKKGGVTVDLRVQKAGDSINRVKCSVDSCEYNQFGEQCIAESIEIQPPGARDTQTTDCATFIPKEGR